MMTRTTSPPGWKVLLDEPLSGPRNMARDHALAVSLEPGLGVLRLYRWSRPTVSLGRNEPTEARFRDFVGQAGELAVVRRPTGGRAVLHDRELTYAVAFHRGAFGGLREAYRRINEGIRAALHSLGVPAEVPISGRALGPAGGPCFSIPAPGEVVVRGRKIVGSAQARIGSRVLQHGSLLLECDQSRLTDLTLSRALREEGAAPITLREVLGNIPTWDDLADAFMEGLAPVLGGPLKPGSLTDDERKAESLLIEKYESPDWTWRR